MFNQTVFYAESGGQVSDVGLIENKDFPQSPCFTYVSTLSVNIFMKSKLNMVNFVSVDTVTLKADENKRHLTMRNHSATHPITSRAE